MPSTSWRIWCGWAGVAGVAIVLAAAGSATGSTFSAIGPDPKAQAAPAPAAQAKALREQVAGEGLEGVAAAKALWAARPEAAEDVLAGSDRQANLNMIAAIRGSSGPSAIRALSLAMVDSQDDVRAAAAEALGVAGSAGGAGLPPAAVRRLVVASEDRAVAVREASVKALSCQSGPAAQKHLAEIALYGSRADVRVTALLAVTQQSRAGHETLLRAAAADRDQHVAGAARAVIDGRLPAVAGSAGEAPGGEAGHLSTIELLGKKGMGGSSGIGPVPAAAGAPARDEAGGLAALLGSVSGGAAPGASAGGGAAAAAAGQNTDLNGVMGILMSALKGSGNSDLGKQAMAGLQQMQADGTLQQLLKALEGQAGGGAAGAGAAGGSLPLDSLSKLAQEYLGKDGGAGGGGGGGSAAAAVAAPAKAAAPAAPTAKTAAPAPKSGK